MNHKIFEIINEYNMVENGDNIIVGVSGGADSMCLLHFLSTIKKEYNLSLTVAHVNYHLRAKESDDDQTFVENWCKRYSIKCEIFHFSSEGKFTEQAGRDVRYRFFEKIAGKNGKIATAHTLSDNMETVLLNLIRGSGTKGMCGIPPVRENIIRPLLNISRQEVEQYCKDNGVIYRTDSSNLSDDYSRNKIRHNVTPVLKQINQSAEENVQRLGKIISMQNEYIEQQVNISLSSAKIKSGYDCERLATLPEYILLNCIVKLLEKVNAKEVSWVKVNLIKDIILNGKGAVNLGDDLTATAAQGIFRFKIDKVDNTLWEKQLFFNDCLDIYNKKLTVKTLTQSEFAEKINIHKKFLKNIVDYDIIKSNVVIRTRRAGDFFSPAGRGVTKTVKKLFIENKIPSERRDEILLLANGSEVLWIEGFGVCEKYIATKKTEKMLYFEVKYK